jgi:hypothetical protein
MSHDFGKEAVKGSGDFRKIKVGDFVLDKFLTKALGKFKIWIDTMVELGIGKDNVNGRCMAIRQFFDFVATTGVSQGRYNLSKRLRHETKWTRNISSKSARRSYDRAQMRSAEHPDEHKTFAQCLAYKNHPNFEAALERAHTIWSEDSEPDREHADFVIGLLTAIVCCEHGQRVGVLQNMQMWEYLRCFDDDRKTFDDEYFHTIKVEKQKGGLRSQLGFH